jgi:hypothetical protein
VLLLRFSAIWFFSELCFPQIAGANEFDIRGND